MWFEVLFPLQGWSLGFKVTTETSRPPSLRPCPLILVRGGLQIPPEQFQRGVSVHLSTRGLADLEGLASQPAPPRRPKLQVTSRSACGRRLAVLKVVVVVVLGVAPSVPLWGSCRLLIGLTKPHQESFPGGRLCWSPETNSCLKTWDLLCL